MPGAGPLPALSSPVFVKIINYSFRINLKINIYELKFISSNQLSYPTSDDDDVDFYGVGDISFV